MDFDNLDWDETLHRFAIFGGIIMAAISIWFSYDGLDSTTNITNPNMSEMAKGIGIAMAVLVTLIQFIFNTDIKELNATLIVGGIISYIYSIVTNYLGINHLFGFSGMLGWIIAFFWDALPEAMIAWGLRDSKNGNMIGNILGSITGARGKSKNKQNQQNQNRPVPQYRPMHSETNRPNNGAGQGKPSSGRADTNPFKKFGE